MPTLPLDILFEYLREGIFITHRHKLIFCNKVIFDWLGYNQNELNDFEMLIAPESKAYILERMQKNRKGETTPNSYIINLLHKNQTDRVHVQINMNHIVGGPWDGYSIGIVRNATLEKVSEKLLEASQQTLEEIISIFPDIYYVTDAKGNLTKVSPSVRQILGYEPDEVIGRNMSTFYPDPSFRDKIVSQVAAGKGSYVRVEAALLHKDGHPVWFNTRARFLFDTLGNVIGLEGVARDNTAELQIQEDLLLHQARHAQMGEMMSAITHQWRQPLGVLNLLISKIELLVKRGNFQNNEILAVTARAEKVIKSMAQTVEDFKNFFVPKSNPISFDLGKSIQESLQMMDGSIAKYQAKLEVQIEPDIYVMGYPTEVGHVIINLIHNAGEALSLKKIADPQIAIRVHKDSQYAYLEVSDNAGGIPHDVLPNIFNPYFTTKKTGTGVGLYMAKNIVTHHMNGEVLVENVQNGARFIIKLPLIQSK